MCMQLVTYCSLAHNRSLSWAKEAADGIVCVLAVVVRLLSILFPPLLKRHKTRENRKLVLSRTAARNFPGKKETPFFVSWSLFFYVSSFFLFQVGVALLSPPRETTKFLFSGALPLPKCDMLITIIRRRKECNIYCSTLRLLLISRPKSFGFFNAGL